VVGALTGAALAAGRLAYQRGEDIERALTLGGYGLGVARGVAEYFTRTQETEREEQSQGMSPAKIKRARTSKEAPPSKGVKKYVKKCMDRILEPKRIDSGTTINPGTSGTVTDLSLWGIQLGTAVNQRVGNNIKLEELQLRFQATGDTTAGDLDPACTRVLIVVDHQCNGALPAVTDVLLQASVISHYNYNNVRGCGAGSGSRFQILKDDVITFNPMPYYNGTSSLAAGMSYFRSWKFKKLPFIQYDANAGAITDLCSKNVFMLTVSDDAQLALAYKFQFCYKDA